jgi:hypothetical protein
MQNAYTPEILNASRNLSASIGRELTQGATEEHRGSKRNASAIPIRISEILLTFQLHAFEVTISVDLSVFFLRISAFLYLKAPHLICKIVRQTKKAVV